MTLSDTAIKKAKPKAKPYKKADGGGMYLEVMPTGSKYWRLKYRFDDKEKRLALGVYPDVSLAQARDRRDDARKLLADDIDPGENRKAIKAARAERGANSFEVVAREWYASKLPEWAPAQAEKVDGILEKNVYPWLGARPIAEIKAMDLLNTLRKAEARGAKETAKRALQISGQVFRYAVATGRAERDITPDLKGALSSPVKSNYPSITDPVKVGFLMRSIDGYIGGMIVRCALKIGALTFVRPGELRKAEWTEIDLDKAEWNIPAERMKMKQPHLVPLSTQAVAVLRELHPLTGSSRYVFPGERTHERPMSENSVNAAMRGMGYSKETMTGHGFRAMARTILDEVLQVRPDFIEHQLAHAVRDPNGRAYNRTAHLAERRKMMQLWADYLDGLKKGADVIPIHSKNVAYSI